jgi:hypothetical protein
LRTVVLFESVKGAVADGPVWLECNNLWFKLGFYETERLCEPQSGPATTAVTATVTLVQHILESIYMAIDKLQA